MNPKQAMPTPADDVYGGWCDQGFVISGIPFYLHHLRLPLLTAFRNSIGPAGLETTTFYTQLNIAVEAARTEARRLLGQDEFKWPQEGGEQRKVMAQIRRAQIKHLQSLMDDQRPQRIPRPLHLAGLSLREAGFALRTYFDQTLGDIARTTLAALDTLDEAGTFIYKGALIDTSDSYHRV